MIGLNKVLKIKINELNESNEITIDESKLYKYATLVRESELIRILKHLNPENLKSDLKCKNKSKSYPFVKDLISVSVEDNTEKYKATKGIISFNGVKFKRIVSSSSNVRNSKVLFIREDLFDKANEILLCGLPNGLMHDCFAKFSAYYALASTDSVPVTMPRIIVINDYKHSIIETFDLVKEVNKDEYKVENNVVRNCDIQPFDGAGLVDSSMAKKWVYNDLKLKYVPSSFQIRCMVGIKGNLYTFNIKEYAKSKGVTKIIDAWEKEWDLFDNNGDLLIDAILTKSQFKFFKQYSSFQDWFEKFNTVTQGYLRTFNISRWSVNPKKLKSESVLSYQPFQTIAISQEQVKLLCARTLEIYKNIKCDVDKFLSYRGLNNISDETGEEINDYFVPPYYEALSANKELFKDDWIQSKIKDDLKGFKNRCCRGMIFTKSSYQTFIPDLVALAECAFGFPVRGVLKKGEVYNKFWYVQGISKLGLVRFPHIAREWKTLNVVLPEAEDVQYLSWMNEGYVINIWDSTALRLGTADFDGDCIYGVAEDTVLSILGEQESNTILFIPNDEKSNDKVLVPINDMAKLIVTDCNGMESNIGSCINQITKLWSLEQNEIVENYIKIMSVIGSKIIDFAKTGIKAEIPNDIKKVLLREKLPYFMKYKYPKISTLEKTINENRTIEGKKGIEKLNRNDCTMNRICMYMESELDKIDKEFIHEVEKNKDNFDWWKLIKSKVNQSSETYRRVKKEFLKLNTQHRSLAQQRLFCTNPENIRDNNYKYKIFYEYCKDVLLLATYREDIDMLLDCMLMICYTNKDFIDKAILWNSFPEEMVNRAKGGYYTEKPFNIEELRFKSENLKKKLIEKKKAAKKVKTELKYDREVKDEKGKSHYEKVNIDVTNINIGITNREIEHINSLELGKDIKKLCIVLFVLNKMCLDNGCKFKISKSRKNKITPAHIVKLSNIDHRKYKEYMILLKEYGVYKPDGDSNLYCSINFVDLGKPEESITNINDVKKYFKKIS